MRFAGERLQDNESMYGNPGSYMQDEEVIPTTEDVIYPQDTKPAGLFGDGVNPTELPGMRDRHMRGLGGGITMLPNGEQGPSQGPNTPIKKYGDSFMPDGTQPSGYRPGPTLAQLAPSMVDGYVDHPAVQDTNMPYILTPDIQQLRRESMNQFQDLPTDMLKRFGFKGV